MIIAIDGPAGSGKSTVARGLARRLGFTYVDSGAMYRAVTLLALERAADLEDDGVRVILDGRDVTEEIRAPEVTRASSASVAGHPEVRAALLEKQRRLIADGDYVVEGRDI